MKIAHLNIVAPLSCAWLTAVVLVWPHAASAGALSADLRVYDWTSLGYSAVLGLLGGLLALIVALATDRRLVHEVLAESWRNALVSPIAGGAAYLCVEFVVGLGWVVVPPVGRFSIIAGSGWAGVAFFVWLRDLVGKAAQAAAQWIINKGKSS